MTDSITLSLLSVLISFPIFSAGLFAIKPGFIMTTRVDKNGNEVLLLSMNKLLLWSMLLSLVVGFFIALIERYKEENQIHTMLLQRSKSRNQPTSL
jgi:hypothetical protein